MSTRTHRRDRPSPSRGARPDWRSPTGSVAVESVVTWPAVLLLIFGIAHGAVWFHARSIALAAAYEGARLASVEQGTGGAHRAREFVSRTGSTAMFELRRVEEVVSESAVTVTVVGSSATFVPGWTIDVSQSSTAALRRWTAP